MFVDVYHKDFVNLDLAESGGIPIWPLGRKQKNETHTFDTLCRLEIA